MVSDKIKEYQKRWHEQHPSYRKEYCKQWHKDNKEYSKQNAKEWFANNKEHRKKYAKQYRKDNYAMFVEAFYKRKGLLQIRSWPNDEEKIKAIYKEAKELNLSVDHEVPLQHSQVCGLHVSWNMKLLPLLENISKGNRTWPDMWPEWKE